ncbi:hypothetical protein B0H17DRAFT_1133240 [Mycena rosella]|uniref:Uncharacterized protein n=1 Tax=Mycena rosella TaxID=1033263 RepID=A0AAD7GF95_MYCRO|nr:hypothetical protein B0H17DRAFT_1133240 [Mycena rosella]
MFFTKAFIAALAFGVGSSAVPTAEVGGLSAVTRFFPVLFPVVTVCIDSLSDPGCTDIPVPSGTCIDLNNELSPWDQAISQGQIPDGYVCTFFDQFECVGDSTSFGVGEANFFPNFNDVTSSFNCVAGVSSTLTVCIDSLSDPGCTGIPVLSGNCIDLTGGLSSWNQAISQALVPEGSVCTFYDQFDCVGNTAFFGPGEADLFPGFNDITSSIDCVDGSVATLALCIDSLSSPSGCVELFVTSESCLDLTDNLSPWNQAISQAQISDGFTCTFFDQFECVGNSALFGSGVANLFPGFNDVTSSISCVAD